MSALDQSAKPSRSPIGAFFAHPASLLLIAGAITALLSGLLVPYITRSWQNHDRKLERNSAIRHEELGVQSDLVKLIGRATADFLGASQLRPYAEPSPATGLTNYDRAYVRWSTSSAEIASQIAAYFPKSSAQRRWNGFSQNMRNTYLLVRNHPGDERKEWLKRVSNYLEINPKVVDGVYDSPLAGESRNQTYEAALRSLLLAIQKKESLVVSDIVEAPSSLRTTDGDDKDEDRPRGR